MKKCSTAWAAFALASWSLHAQQQEVDSLKRVELDEVVLTDTRFTLKREQSGKTVIRIGADQLAREQGKTLAEVLNQFSGIEINGSRSNALNNVTVFARGGNNRQVLVLIDGIQVSDPSNVNAEFDLRLLDLSQIETIEVMKGAASTLYGNAAATAVISITTKKGTRQGFSLSGESSAGTNQDQNQDDFGPSDFSNSIQLGYKQGAWNATLAYANQYTDGLSAAVGEESDLLNRNKFRANVTYRPNGRWSFGLTGFNDYLRGEIDNGFPVEDALFELTTEQRRFAFTGVHKYGEEMRGSLEAKISHASIDREFRTDFPSAFESEVFTADVYNKHQWSTQWYTLTGVNIIQMSTLFGEGTFETNNTDPYFSLIYLGKSGLNFHGGARLNIHSDYGANFIYHFNPSYRFGVGQGYLKLLGSLATSYIAPNLSQLYGPFGANPELEAETNRTLEIGLEHKRIKSRFSALFFNRLEENGIDFMTIDFTTFEGEYQNSRQEARFRGVEVEGEFELSSSLQLLANYTFVEQEGGLALRVPKHKLNSQLQWQVNKKSNASLDLRYTGVRKDVDFGSFENVELDAFLLLNAYYGYRFSPSFRAFVQLENIGNADYVEVSSFSSRGRNLRLGFSWQLN